jgi:hypothetical protein
MFRFAAVIVYFADGVPQQNIRDGTGEHNPILRNPGPYPNAARRIEVAHDLTAVGVVV